MELIKKPDYCCVVPEHAFDHLKLFFLSRHLGLPPREEDDDYPEPPDPNVLQKIEAYFPLNPSSAVFMNQVHGDLIIHKTNRKHSFPTADAVITDQKGVALCVKTADCVPLFLFDKKNRIVGAVHAGWRGTALKIARKTLLKMEHFFKTEMENVHAFIGPAIGSCCYEVGKDVFDAFHFLGKARQDYFSRLRNGRFMMDMKGINVHILELEGVPPENIEMSDLCTCCEKELFHSFRRDGTQSGRNVSFITLTK